MFRRVSKKGGWLRRARRPLHCEQLEQRFCLSLFYDFDLIGHRTGIGLTDLSAGIFPKLSINDDGQVAFLTNGEPDGIYVGDGSGPPINIALV